MWGATAGQSASRMMMKRQHSRGLWRSCMRLAWRSRWNSSCVLTGHAQRQQGQGEELKSSGVGQHLLASRRRYYSSYEYPLRTEAPIVTKTRASDCAPELQSQSESNKKSKGEAVPSPEPRAPPPSKLSPGTTMISSAIPSHIPANVSSEELSVPETLVTRLDDSNIHVVSQETYGQVSCVGVVCEVGSRFEPHPGMTQLLEILAFGPTPQWPSSQDITLYLQDIGGMKLCHTGREQSLFGIDILRPHVPNAMMLLQQVLYQPTFSDDELEQAKRTVEFLAHDLLPEVALMEVLQTAAYGADQPLGKPHFIMPHHISAMQQITPSMVRDYWQECFVQHPRGLVIAGAGIEHEKLVELTQTHFKPYMMVDDPAKTSPAAASFVPSVYRGGHAAMQRTTEDGLLRVALALEVEGWWNQPPSDQQNTNTATTYQHHDASDDLVPTCVLSTLLGGGNSFSAGGPGKGMYSRLYRQVLNRYSWAESAEAFTQLHSESGLLGISGSCHVMSGSSNSNSKTRDLTLVLAEHLIQLATIPVSDEELYRARNMLKCNVLTQLESRVVLFEDMGRQVLTYGQREDIATMCAKIDAVTKDDLMRLMQRALAKPPTLAAVGDNVTQVPSYDEVVRWFN